MGLWARSNYVTSLRYLACVLLASTACHARPAPVVSPPEPQSAFSLRVTPAVLLERQALRLTCFVPWDDDNRAIRFGIEDISVASTEIDRQQYSRVFERMECGTWTATCAVVDKLGKLAIRTQEVTVKGMCNGG